MQRRLQSCGNRDYWRRSMTGRRFRRSSTYAWLPLPRSPRLWQHTHTRSCGLVSRWCVTLRLASSTPVSWTVSAKSRGTWRHYSSDVSVDKTNKKWWQLTCLLVVFDRAEGLLGFYKGVAPNVIRVLPGTCITFLVYETVSAWCRNHARYGLDE